MQQNAHMYSFWNSPLSLRKAWTKFQMEVINTRLTAGGYPSADAYYSDKQEYIRMEAALENKQPYEVNPMGFWFQQSN